MNCQCSQSFFLRVSVCLSDFHVSPTCSCSSSPNKQFILLIKLVNIKSISSLHSIHLKYPFRAEQANQLGEHNLKPRHRALHIVWHHNSINNKQHHSNNPFKSSMSYGPLLLRIISYYGHDQIAVPLYTSQVSLVRVCIQSVSCVRYK